MQEKARTRLFLAANFQQRLPAKAFSSSVAARASFRYAQEESRGGQLSNCSRVGATPSAENRCRLIHAAGEHERADDEWYVVIRILA